MERIILTDAIKSLAPNKPFVISYANQEATESDLSTLVFEDGSSLNNSDIVAEYDRLKAIKDARTSSETAKEKLLELGFNQEEINILLHT